MTSVLSLPAIRSRAPPRSVSRSTWLLFAVWTGVLWGFVGVMAVLFFVGAIDFTTSTKASLYSISVWLNGWLAPLLWRRFRERRPVTLSVWHECLTVWTISYTMTNCLWEIPWLLASPHVFEDLNTLDDVVALTEWMRESVAHMYFWTLSSFASVDLRTVNHNSTFYSLEIYAFVNVFSSIYFLYLNHKRSPYRYLIPVLGCGEPIVATFIFTMSEVLGGLTNMPGGVADTLLALLWTQYQYILFPMIFGVVATRLLFEDWRVSFFAGVGGRSEDDDREECAGDEPLLAMSVYEDGEDVA